MNEWSLKRQRIIFAIVSFVLVVVIGVPSFLLIYNKPTCFDGKQNGNELGVDCGGSCQLICNAESLPLILDGDPRVIEVSPGFFEVVAVVNNPNVSAEIYRAFYKINLFESGSAVPVKTVEGEAYVPKNGRFVVFEGPFDMKESRPNRATLEWDTSNFIWQTDTDSKPNLELRNVALSGADTNPRIDGLLVNNSLDHVSNVELTAVVSEESGNLVAASKTFIEDVSSGSLVPFIFTWPAPLQSSEKVCSHPVDIALVIDRSGSMEFLSKDPPQPMTDVKDTALYFVNELGENDKVSLVSFANEASLDATLGLELDAVRTAVSGIFIRTDVVQNTDIGGGLLVARDELNSSRRRGVADRAMILLTDGVPTLPVSQGNSKYPFEYAVEVADTVKAGGINLFTIGLGKDVDSELLKSLATTADDAYLAPTTNELRGIYNQIATKICRQSPTAVDVYIRVLPDQTFLK